MPLNLTLNVSPPSSLSSLYAPPPLSSLSHTDSFTHTSSPTVLCALSTRAYRYSISTPRRLLRRFVCVYIALLRFIYASMTDSPRATVTVATSYPSFDCYPPPPYGIFTATIVVRGSVRLLISFSLLLIASHCCGRSGYCIGTCYVSHKLDLAPLWPFIARPYHSSRS